MDYRRLRETSNSGQPSNAHQGWPFIRRLISIASGLLAVIALATGSLLVCSALLWPQRPEYDQATQQLEAAGYAVRVGLPVTLISVWVLLAIALVGVRQPKKAAWSLLLCLVGIFGAFFAPLNGPFPLKGFAATTLILGFVFLNVTVLYAVWRYILVD